MMFSGFAVVVALSAIGPGEVQAASEPGGTQL